MRGEIGFKCTYYSNTIYFQTEDLEVDQGVWRGETSISGYDIFPNGWGTLIYNADDSLNRAKYEGWMVNGVMDGYGTMWWRDGSKYTGKFVNNTKEGYGAMFYKNGDIFSGTWFAEKKGGASEHDGMYMFAGGAELVGAFSKGKLNGFVKKLTIPLQDGLVDTFEGEYSEGFRTVGTYGHGNGDVYNGKVLTVKVLFNY